MNYYLEIVLLWFEVNEQTSKIKLSFNLRNIKFIFLYKF